MMYDTLHMTFRLNVGWRLHIISLKNVCAFLISPSSSLLVVCNTSLLNDYKNVKPSASWSNVPLKQYKLCSQTPAVTVCLLKLNWDCMVFYGRTCNHLFLDYLFHDDARIIGTFYIYFLLVNNKINVICQLTLSFQEAWQHSVMSAMNLWWKMGVSRNNHRLACNMDKLALI